MPMNRAPRQLLTGWVAHPRPIGCPEMSFGRTLKKAPKRNGLPTDFTTWSAIARDRPRWRLLTHSTPTPSPPTPSPPTPSPLTPSPPTPSPQMPNQAPANPNAPLPGYGNLAPACGVPTWHAPPRSSAIRRNARRRPRRPLRCPRQPRQRSNSAAPSYARHRARQLKKTILNTFPTISGCFVLGCHYFVARIYCDGQYFYWAARLVFGNKRRN
jgi:hypothetical protein